MTPSHDRLTPSLLEDASRGGDTNESGISFQANVILLHIPRWLAMEGFTSMVREAVFDVEAKFFIPGRNVVKEATEIKNHLITPSEFWTEIDRFEQVDAGSPGSYQWFTLVSTGLSNSLLPLRNGLRRIREPYGFYFDDSTIWGNSFRDYLQTVERLGRTQQDAEFLYRKVLLQADMSPNQAYGKAMFKQALNDYLPYHQNMPDRVLEDIYAHLGAFVQGRRNQTIARRELEEKLRDRVPPSLRPSPAPVRLHTTLSDSEAAPTAILFKWASFFGGEARDYPMPEIWNQRLLNDLRETRDWILEHREIRRVYLSGNRRLSASLAIGFIFSAVAGFSIDMAYRGEVWPTDAHASSETPSYSLSTTGSSEDRTGDRLIVTVGILRDIVADVESDLPRHGLVEMPTLHIHGDQAIQSPQQLNLVVREIKGLISRALARTGAGQIALFIAGPAPLALFLGHRLNATAAVQCYEQSGSGGYVPTCQLI